MKSNVIDLREPGKPPQREPHPYGGEKVPPLKRRKEPERVSFSDVTKSSLMIIAVLRTKNWSN